MITNQILILKRIRETIASLLRDGVFIQDIVFRPFDMEIFGPKGYSFVLTKPPKKMLGFSFSDEPTDEQIKDAVEQVQNIIAP